MWSAPALGSEKEIIRIELIHALEVGLHNQCGALLIAPIIDQTEPNHQQHWQSPIKPNQTSNNNIGKIHLEVLVTHANDDDRHWEARCRDHCTLSVVNHDVGDGGDNI